MNQKISNPGGDIDGIKIGYDTVMDGNILVTTSKTKILRNLRKTKTTKDKLDKQVYFKKMGGFTHITIKDEEGDLVQFLITEKSHINKLLRTSAPPEMIQVIKIGIEMANAKTLGEILEIKEENK